VRAYACAVLLVLCATQAPGVADGRGDTLDRIPVLDPNAAEFPDASIADAGDLLSAPAGRHGSMFVGNDGRFYFQDGSRARFWGINVAKDSVFQSRPVIDAAIAAIARAGFNLVRLHHLDDEAGLLPASRAGATPRIDPQRLDIVDYWIAHLKERGIYVYLDLLDFRTFRAAEGVPRGDELGRGAKPYAFLDARIIALQQQYASELLFDHTNPYTGLTYAQDPAVCLVELCDENGLFHEEKRLGDLKSPYRESLVRLWNRWLAGKYGTRGKLAGAWTVEDVSQLSAEEDPRGCTVGLPGVSEGCDGSPPRMVDRAQFFAGIHRGYLRTMVAFLRRRGLKCPVSAVTKPQVLPDLWASAEELDFIACNYYFDHPYFRPESNWQLPAFITGSSPLRAGAQEAFAPNIARVRVAGKPLVVREWGVCWPNEFRGPGMLQAAAYASLQDVDAMILFTLDARRGSAKLGYFDVRRDPTRWGLAPLCARLFLQRQIRPAEGTVRVSHSLSDVFAWPARTLPDAPYEAARVSGIANVFAGDSSTTNTPQAPTGAFVSDTDEIVLDQDAGLLRITSPSFHAVAGELAQGAEVICGPVQFRANATVSTCAWQSLDGLPPGRSRRWVVRYVSLARNSDQQVRVHLKKKNETILALDSSGRAPVTTLGEPSSAETAVWVDGEALLRAFMRNGSFELCRLGSRLYLYCDTPGVRLELPGLGRRIVGAFHPIGGATTKLTTIEQPFKWPVQAALLEIPLDR